MKILETNDGFALQWEYAIKNNVTMKKDVEYVSHEASFPIALSEYFGVDELFLYLYEGRILASTETPPYFSVKQKLFKKNKTRPQRTMSLSKKIFHLHGQVHGVVAYRFHIDEVDPITGKLGLLEVDLSVDDF